MKKTQKSFLSIFLNGIANIFSFKGYSRRRKRNYFTRTKP